MPDLIKWIEIDMKVIASNVRLIKKALRKDTALMAVVKADGYGHGALMTARTALSNGASFLGVFNVEEALRIRKDGIDAPIMTLSPCLPDELSAASRNGVIPTIDSIELLEKAGKISTGLLYNLDIDTGLRRWGLDPAHLRAFLKKALSSRARMFSFSTHIAYTPYRNMTDAYEKLSFFSRLSADIKKIFPGAVSHAANSLILCDFPDFQFDMARVGNLIYGIYPSDIYCKRKGGAPLSGIKRPWKFFARIISVKKVKAGESFGYAGEITASRNMTIASIPVGYSDGLTLEPQENSYRLTEGTRYWAEINGKKAPFAAKSSICNTIIDITDIPEARPGTVVSLAIRRTAANARIARIYV